MFMQTSMQRNSREGNGNSHEQSITNSFETKYSYISIGQIHDSEDYGGDDDDDDDDNY